MGLELRDKEGNKVRLTFLYASKCIQKLEFEVIGVNFRRQFVYSARAKDQWRQENEIL